MRVTIFGATGSLGRECLEQCLDAGHEVTVVARTPGDDTWLHRAPVIQY